MGLKIGSWKIGICLVTPMLLSPLLFLDTEESQKLKCLYVILLMDLFWMSEALPLAVTALIPVALFPLLGIQSTGDVVSNYMKESGMLFIGGISLALSIQYCGLHKRIALNTMLLVGTSPWRLLLGVMITTFTLSCWIAVNTSVVAMMIPIVSGLIEASSSNYISENEKEEKKNLRVLLFLAVGYSANVGGTSVMIGSVPSIIYRNLISMENVGQDGKYTDVNFATWIAFAFPIAFLNLVCIWLFLGYYFIVRRKYEKTASESIEEESSTKALLSSKLEALGPISFHEKGVATIFIVTIFLWFLREPKLFPGWLSFPIFPPHIKIGDASVAIFTLLFMFIVPKAKNSNETLMNWSYLQENFPWNVILLVGGGFALSDGAQKSGLSLFIGEKLSLLESLPKPLLLFLILLILSLFTEITSNAATVSLMTPILLALSKKLEYHPLYLSFAGSMACQYAFILPTSNPPNAIVFSAGKMDMKDMAVPGIFLNFICLSLLYIMNVTWGEFIFNFADYEYATANATINAL